MNGVREQAPLEQAQSQVMTYTRPNGDDIVGNAQLIENVRDEQSRDIIDNCRVGNYDNQGNYVIDADIIKELIGMNKTISREAFEKVTSENKTEVEFKLMGRIPLFGEMEFRLVVTKFDARLYLIEEVFREGGGYLETYGEKIAEYVSDRVEKDDLQNIFATFNISIVDDDDEDEGKKFKDEDDQVVDKLLIRKIYLSLLAKNLVDYTAAEEKESFDKIVEILKNRGGEYGKRVLRNFIDRLERRPEVMGIKDKNGYNKALNDMLIGSLEVVTTQEDLQDENIRKIFEEINNIRNRRTQEHIDKAKQLITAEQVKQVYDKIKGPRQGGLTLTDIQKTIADTQETLNKQPISRQPAQPVLKQDTREAILKQTPKNAVVEEAAPVVEAAAVKKEAPAAEAGAKKPVKKEEKAPAKKAPAAKAPAAKNTSAGGKTKGKEKGKEKSASSGGGSTSPVGKQKENNVGLGVGIGETYFPRGYGQAPTGGVGTAPRVGDKLNEALARSPAYQEFLGRVRAGINSQGTPGGSGHTVQGGVGGESVGEPKISADKLKEIRSGVNAKGEHLGAHPSTLILDSPDEEEPDFGDPTNLDQDGNITRVNPSEGITKFGQGEGITKFGQGEGITKFGQGDGIKKINQDGTVSNYNPEGQIEGFETQIKKQNQGFQVPPEG